MNTRCAISQFTLLLVAVGNLVAAASPSFATPLLGSWEDTSSSQLLEFLDGGRLLESDMCSNLPLTHSRYTLLDPDRVLIERPDGDTRLLRYELKEDQLLIEDTQSGSRSVLAPQKDYTDNFANPLLIGQEGQGFILFNQIVFYYNQVLFPQVHAYSELRFSEPNGEGFLFIVLWDQFKGGYRATLVNIDRREIVVPAFEPSPMFIGAKVIWSPEGWIGLVWQAAEVINTLWIINPAAHLSDQIVRRVTIPNVEEHKCELQFYRLDEVDWSQWNDTKAFVLPLRLSSNPWNCEPNAVPDRTVDLLISHVGEVQIAGSGAGR